MGLDLNRVMTGLGVPGVLAVHLGNRIIVKREHTGDIIGTITHTDDGVEIRREADGYAVMMVPLNATAIAEGVVEHLRLAPDGGPPDAGSRDPAAAVSIRPPASIDDPVAWLTERLGEAMAAIESLQREAREAEQRHRRTLAELHDAIDERERWRRAARRAGAIRP